MERKEAIEVVKKNWPDSSFTRLREALETLIPELKESKDEKIRKKLISLVENWKIFNPNSPFDEHPVYTSDKDTVDKILAWLEKQGEQKPYMIQWKGDNLKEVIDFVGKDKNFEKWFKSFEEYEKYVCDHNGIFKLFNADGSHYEIPVGAWIVKTPDGYNVASKAKYKQKPADKIEPNKKFTPIESALKDLICDVDNSYTIEQVRRFLFEYGYKDKILNAAQEEMLKPAWSEEDENFLKEAIKMIEMPGSLFKGKDLQNKIVNWLKSIKPQNKWKPSNEQMEALEHFIVYHNGSTNYAKDLEELRIQLKRLREE